MSYTLTDCRHALVDALLHEWRQPVRDFQSSQEATPHRIQKYFEASAVGRYVLREYTPDGMYNEQWRNKPPQSWCGLFVGWGGLRMGNFLEEGQCLDLQLHHHIVDFIVPGTDRLYDKHRWSEQGLPFPDQPGIDDLTVADVITVGSEVDGSHIAVVQSQPRENPREIETIEGNSSDGQEGVLGDGKHGEGVIKTTRHVDEIKQTYRLVDHPYLQGSLDIEGG